MELQSRVDQLRTGGLGVTAISYDSPEVLAAFSQRRGITFPLLSDQGSATITRYGILNTAVEEGLGPNGDDPALSADLEKYVSPWGATEFVLRTVRGTPFPGTFIIDRQGRVTSRFFEEFYKERTTASNIMLRLGMDTNQVSGTRGSTAHLAIGTSQSNAEISTGTRFALILDIEPEPGIHVYAPGAEALGYRVVAFTLEEESFFRALPLQYPTSEIYHFEPLDERVPVYRAPFRLVQEVVLNATPEVEDALGQVPYPNPQVPEPRDVVTPDVLTLTGTLDYQACDEEVCFNPVSVPLSWTIALAHHDPPRDRP